MHPAFFMPIIIALIFATAIALDVTDKRSARKKEIQNAVENYEEWEVPSNFTKARLDPKTPTSTCTKCGMDDERIVYAGFDMRSTRYCFFCAQLMSLQNHLQVTGIRRLRRRYGS